MCLPLVLFCVCAKIIKKQQSNEWELTQQVRMILTDEKTLCACVCVFAHVPSVCV